MPTEEQNSYDSDQILAFGIFVPSGHVMTGQRLPIIGRRVDSISLYLKRVGTPTTTYMYFQVRTVVGGIDLASATLTRAEVLAIPTDYTLVTIPITPVNIAQEVRIFTGITLGDDAGNCIKVAYQSTDAKANEQRTYSNETYSFIDTTGDIAYQYTYTSIFDVVTTQAVTNISGTTATGHGTNSITGATQHGSCWNTTGTPTTADSKTTQGVPALGAFASNITGLTAGLKYYVRAYVTISGTTYYGTEVSFTADKGTVSPTDPITRVSGITRTFWSGAGGLASYQAQLFCGGVSPTYVPPISPRTIPGVEPEPQTVTQAYAKAGPGYQQEDYARWLTNSDNIRVYIQVFGRFPTYEGWLTNVIPGRVHQFK